MKSVEVYQEIHRIIYPKLNSFGFAKAKSGMLGYSKPLKDHYLLIWFQCSQDGFDVYAGSKFVVEIQLSRGNRIGDVSIVRQRIPFFMTDSELEDMARMQNEVVERLTKPDKSYFIFGLDDDVQRWYLNKFEKSNRKYARSTDIWFTYFDSHDIKRWIEVLAPIIIRALFDLEGNEYSQHST